MLAITRVALWCAMGLTLPTGASAQTVMDILQGTWRCDGTLITRDGQVIGTVSAIRIYEGNRVRGQVTVQVAALGAQPPKESVATYSAKVRLQKGMIRESSHRTQRVSDIIGGAPAFVPKRSSSFSESYIDTAFPAAVALQSNDALTLSPRGSDMTTTCRRAS